MEVVVPHIRQRPHWLLIQLRVVMFSWFCFLPALSEPIPFVTLRRRSPALLREVINLPASAWRTVTLDLPQRKYKTPRVYEQKVCPRSRTFRQFFIKDLGHDEPT